ncbi:MAG TPA: hypothetical protein VFY68_07510 [Nitrososphaeraceae archaeon]|nr:hypothetical protein [Nitrososphaeraceae archaeon]
MNHSEEEKTTTIAIIAIVAALGLLRVVVVTVAVTIPQQQVEAAGCINPNARGGGSRAFNASQGR